MYQVGMYRLNEPCYWLGTHMSADLAHSPVPLLISYNRLPKRDFPRALAPWEQDAQTWWLVSKLGHHKLTAKESPDRTVRHAREIGNLAAAWIQDWTCDPESLRRTGLSVRQHQMRTIWSLLELRARAPSIPWRLVLQGFEPGDYLRHIDLYESAGIFLNNEDVVGVGSLVSRQAEPEAEEIVRVVHSAVEAPLHYFGGKIKGLHRAGDVVDHADSTGWSRDARFNDPLPGCTHKGSCANCLRYALLWRERVMEVWAAARRRGAPADIRQTSMW